MSSRFTIAIASILACTTIWPVATYAIDRESISELADSTESDVSDAAKKIQRMMGYRKWKRKASNDVSGSYEGFADGKVMIRSIQGGRIVKVPITELGDDEKDAVFGILQAGSDLLQAVSVSYRSNIERQTREMREEKSQTEELKAELNEARERVSKLESELRMFKPGIGMGADGTPVLTAKKIEILGEDYIGKGTVRLVNAKFWSADPGYPEAPGAAAGTGTYFPAVAKQWLAVMVEDEEGESFQYAWARKEDFGEFFAVIKRNTRIDIEGFIIRSRRNDKNQFVVTAVTRSAEQKR